MDGTMLFDINRREREEKQKMELRALSAQAELPSAIAGLERELERVNRELKQTRDEFADYKAKQRAQREQDRLEQAKTNKQVRRRSWAQVIIPLILSPLITLLIEHHKEIAAWIRVSFFH